MKTLIISKQEVLKLLPLTELISETRKAYTIFSTNKLIKPKRAVCEIDQTSVVVNMPGSLPDSSMFTVKVNIKVPTNFSIGLPFLSGTILLFDKKTGYLLSIMDSGLITAMRTGAAGAVGVECLAHPDANRVAVIGAGVQAEWQIRALYSINKVKNVFLYDIIESRSILLAERLSAELNIKISIANSVKEAINQSEIAILTTQSKTPILTRDLLHPGLHINAFGADQPGKVELDADVINYAKIFVDDKDLALSDGALNVAYKSNLITKTSCPEIGELISGKIAGRTSADEITVFGNVGLAFQDLIACSIIYRKALEQKKGEWIDFDTSVNIPPSLKPIHSKKGACDEKHNEFVPHIKCNL